ncbi:hypothetical protein [Streptomyces sp. NRRL F-5135]|uniref:hypothetical protein n=1 Tax=Streptomyces sp. NRRL F-5135 TaxID=1463858 RepID=UPI0004C7F3C2|nr:hypothetical protein [Streptomyces sp. NRRL F-5135]
MAAEIEAPVEVTTCLPGATPIGGRIGTLTVTLRDETLHLKDVYRALGETLVEAGTYLIEQGALPVDEAATD